MTQEEFTQVIDEKIKLIRTEYGLTQDKMAIILGISKKTLIEVEKRRKSAGWTVAVAIAGIFSDSAVLRDALGGDVTDLLLAIAFNETEVDYPVTWGGKVWWDTVLEKAGFRIQQNIFSRHYRLLDATDRRILASFDLDEVKRTLQDILKDK